MSKADQAPTFSRQLQRNSDVADVRRRLQDWFKGRIPDAKNVEVLAVNRTSGEAGRSADIFIVVLRWRDGASGEVRDDKVVVRAEIDPPTNVLSNSRNMIGVLQRLGARTDLPVPKVFWVEEDRDVLGAPFCVMQLLPGVVAPDSPPFTAAGWVAEATPEQRERMYRSGISFLTRLHALDWRALGLDFLLAAKDGQSHTAALVNQTVELYDAAVDGRRGDAEEAAIRWLTQNVPANENLRVCWGDARPGNVLWKDFEVAGALDWEMVMLLDPAYDVALWLYADYMLTEAAGIQRLPGMMMRDEFIREYEAMAGSKLDNFAYFEVFSAFRSHANVANMMRIWERNGQHLFGEGVTLERSPTRKAFVHIASRHI